MIIRKAEPADDDAVGELLIEAFLSTYARKLPGVIYDDARKKDLRDVAAKRARALVLVAEKDERVIGTVAIFKPGADGSEAWRPNTADLRHLAVEPAHHGRGVAGPLLDRAEAVARDEWKVDAIGLHVRQGADGVARLYERRGYRRDPSGDLRKPTVMLEAYLLTWPHART